jgi:hypothetical protein
MDVTSAATAATAMKAANVKTDAGNAVVKQAFDQFKSDGELLMQLLYKSLGIGGNINVTA